MTDRLRIVIDGPRLYYRGRGSAKVMKQGWWVHPSLNEWVAKRNPFARDALKKTWTDKVVAVCHGLDPIHGQVIVTVCSFLATDRPADIDNYTPKFIMDGLVEAGIIDGDSRRIVIDLRTRIRVDRARPRTEVEIWKPSPSELYELGLATAATQEPLLV